jgi:hypothetical protein
MGHRIFCFGHSDGLYACQSYQPQLFSPTEESRGFRVTYKPPYTKKKKVRHLKKLNKFKRFSCNVSKSPLSNMQCNKNNEEYCNSIFFTI